MAFSQVPCCVPCAIEAGLAGTAMATAIYPISARAADSLTVRRISRAFHHTPGKPAARIRRRIRMKKRLRSTLSCLPAVPGRTAARPTICASHHPPHWPSDGRTWRKLEKTELPRCFHATSSQPPFPLSPARGFPAASCTGNSEVVLDIADVHKLRSA